MQKMTEKISKTGRREVLQQMAMVMAGVGLSFLSGSGQAMPVLPRGAGIPDGDYPVKPFTLPPGEPLQPGPAGMNIRVLIHSSQTNMQYASAETVVAPKIMGPPPHVHKALDEIMLVLEGTASVLMGDHVDVVVAGGWHIRPRGIVHTFWNATDQPLRFIDMYFNQNFDDFLEELFYRTIPEIMRKSNGKADPWMSEEVAELQEKFGITMFPGQRQMLIDQYGLKG